MPVKVKLSSLCYILTPSFCQSRTNQTINALLNIQAVILPFPEKIILLLIMLSLHLPPSFALHLSLRGEDRALFVCCSEAQIQSSVMNGLVQTQPGKAYRCVSK